MHGVFALKILQKKIALAREAFVLEIEQGAEVFIPHELSQDKLPLSFRFYDPVLKIIHTNMSHERKQYFSLKTEFNLNRIKD
mmetsp:Transcript_21305/g.32979  ORF Transcript_21305/g.32979 Transcript_21305/m.32979 type:complete len:82 (-) Transcript_21305:1133-1378(-)